MPLSVGLRIFDFTSKIPVPLRKAKSRCCYEFLYSELFRALLKRSGMLRPLMVAMNIPETVRWCKLVRSQNESSCFHTYATLRTEMLRAPS